MEELEKIKNLIAEYGLRTKYVVTHPNHDPFYHDQKKAVLDLEKEVAYIIKERDDLHNQVISLQHRITALEEEHDINTKTIHSLKQLLQEMHGFIANG